MLSKQWQHELCKYDPIHGENGDDGDDGDDVDDGETLELELCPEL